MEDLDLKLNADDEETRLGIRSRNEDNILRDDNAEGWVNSLQKYIQSR